MASLCLDRLRSSRDSSSGWLFTPVALPTIQELESYSQNMSVKVERPSMSVPGLRTALIPLKQSPTLHRRFSRRTLRGGGTNFELVNFREGKKRKDHLAPQQMPLQST